MVAEHIELHNELAEQRSTISSRSAGLHTVEWVNPPSLSVDDSLLAIGPSTKQTEEETQDYRESDMTTIIHIVLHYRGANTQSEKRTNVRRGSSTSSSRSTRRLRAIQRRRGRKTISDQKEAFYYYSRMLQYTLNKATKGEPHKYAPQCNTMNSSGFETWRQLHATYDQGEKAQQLHALNRITTRRSSIASTID
eukprot:2324161-Amphidinium_carterae.3